MPLFSHEFLTFPWIPRISWSATCSSRTHFFVFSACFSLNLIKKNVLQLTQLVSRWWMKPLRLITTNHEWSKSHHTQFWPNWEIWKFSVKPYRMVGNLCQIGHLVSRKVPQNYATFHFSWKMHPFWFKRDKLRVGRNPRTSHLFFTGNSIPRRGELRLWDAKSHAIPRALFNFRKIFHAVTADKTQQRKVHYWACFLSPISRTFFVVFPRQSSENSLSRRKTKFF